MGSRNPVLDELNATAGALTDKVWHLCGLGEARRIMLDCIFSLDGKVKLTGHFQRQHWRRDGRAEDIGSSFEVDLTRTFFTMPLDELNHVIGEIRQKPPFGPAQDTDLMAEAAGLFAGFGRNDTGYLSVYPADLAAFLESLGGPGEGRLTENDRVAMRQAWSDVHQAMPVSRRP